MSRIFLIGNGSSLNQTPLHLLKDEVTMGVNKIGSIFKPSYYVKIDFSEFDKTDWKDEVVPMLDVPCLLWDAFKDGGKDSYKESIPDGVGDHSNVTWVERCKHHGNKNYLGNWHDPFCTAHNSIVTMVQWAEKLGFDEIYLVGCDGVFTDGVSDHFMPYHKKIDINYKERNDRCIRLAHELIQRSCTVPIYNATVGGVIENYERVFLEDVLSG